MASPLSEGLQIDATTCSFQFLPRTPSSNTRCLMPLYRWALGWADEASGPRSRLPDEDRGGGAGGSTLRTGASSPRDLSRRVGSPA